MLILLSTNLFSQYSCFNNVIDPILKKQAIVSSVVITNDSYLRSKSDAQKLYVWTEVCLAVMNCGGIAILAAASTIQITILSI